MYVTVHRETQQAGGDLIEIGTSRTRLLFDTGAGLPPLNGPETGDGFELDGLTRGTPSFDWVFLSHHHNGHCELVRKMLPGIHVLAGAETKRILDVIADFTGQPRPEIFLRFRDGHPIQLNDIRVTPVGVGHSAGDACLFLVQADGESVLYMGDFRVSEKVLSVVKKQMSEGDRLSLLITEGIDIRRGKRERVGEPQGEKWVKQQAAEWMRSYKGTVFVLCSSADEDRIQAVSSAASLSGRTVCEDLFQSAVRNCADANAQWFVADPVKRDSPAWPYLNRLYRQKALVGAEALAGLPEQKVIFVRATMLPFIIRYMSARKPETEKSPLLIYSVWQGCKRTAAVRQVFNFCAERNISVKDLYTSGHAGLDTMKSLFDGLNPAALLPVHCEAEDRDEFRSLHNNCWMLPDGERREI